MTEEVRKGTVILFRSPKDGEEDLYGLSLKEAGFLSFNIPVLDFQFVNLDDLYQCLMRSNDFSGLILTSPRAVEACSRALQNLSRDEKKKKDCLAMICYCVGPSTSQHTNNIGFKSVDCEAGNADKLAKYIIENNAIDKKPFLYPSGNLRRDTLSVKLKAEGFSLKEITVYETIKSKTVREDVKRLIEIHGQPNYTVYFSPSGVQYTADLFESDILKLNDIKVIAIGSTTEAELKEKNIAVAATAKTPDHTGVTAAILQASC